MRGNHPRGTLNQTTKGHKNGYCNVTACQCLIGTQNLLGEDVDLDQYFNLVMNAWYCLDCATDIQYYADKDGLVLFEELAEV